MSDDSAVLRSPGPRRGFRMRLEHQGSGFTVFRHWQRTESGIPWNSLRLIIAAIAAFFVTAGPFHPVAAAVDDPFILEDSGQAPLRNMSWTAGTGRFGVLFNERFNPFRIELNHTRFWDGAPLQQEPESTAPAAIPEEALDEIGAQLASGQYAEARSTWESAAGLPETALANYLPVCDLMMDFEALRSAETLTRKADLRRQLFTTTVVADGHEFERTCFINPVMNIMGIRLVSHTPKLLNGKIELRSRIKDSKVGFTGDGFFHCSGKPEEKRIPGLRETFPSAASFDVRIMPRILRDGRMIITYKDIQLVDVSEVILFVSLQASRDYPGILDLDPAAWNEKALLPWRSVSWEEALDRHLESVTPLMEATRLQLSESDEPIVPDSADLERIFQFARHAALSTRWDNTVPMTSPWSFNPRPADGARASLDEVLMTFRGTLHTAPGGLETWRSMRELTGDLLRRGGSLSRKLGVRDEKARVLFSSIDGWNSIADDPSRWQSLWPYAGGWAAHLLWEASLIHPDKRFREKTVLPLLEASTRFFLEFHHRPGSSSLLHEKWLHSGPHETWDPESNRWMNLQIMLQTLQDYLEAGDARPESSSGASVQQLRQAALEAGTVIRRSLLKMRRSMDGIESLQPQAWWGLYPGAIDRDLLPGWDQPVIQPVPDSALQVAWTGYLLNRLQQRDAALKILSRLISPDFTGPNFLGTGPRLESTPVCMAHGLLLDSIIRPDGAVIELLPTSPLPWKDGSVSGVALARGIELNLSWKDGIPESVRLHRMNDAASDPDSSPGLQFRFGEKLSLPVKIGSGETLEMPFQNLFP